MGKDTKEGEYDKQESVTALVAQYWFDSAWPNEIESGKRGDVDGKAIDEGNDKGAFLSEKWSASTISDLKSLT